jgi:Reverse transcriptase (RNA-dependent DNA polymerase)
MARNGDLSGAKTEIEAIKALRAGLEKSNQSYWADRSEEQILAISAWVALKEGPLHQAIKFMRAAADGEDGIPALRSTGSAAFRPRSPPIRFLEHRIGDRRIIRLIQKWLKAGVLEDGVVMVSDRGTGQGSVISPLLANVYLHYALDLWTERWRRREATGDMIIVRYADDCVPRTH